MDKAEYQEKLEELTGYVNDRDFESAILLVNEIDWKRVKSVRTLNMVADVYEANGEYDDAKSILKLALTRASVGRSILGRLVEVCIKTGEVGEAEDYFDQFSELAGNDNSRLVLQYKLFKAKRAPLEAQISVLEEYREREYTEKWAYELASLYAKAGDEKRCVEACDDLILWFGGGKYALKAMDLKMKYEPLTHSQKKLYQVELEKAEQEAAKRPVRRVVVDEGSEEMKGKLAEDIKEAISGIKTAPPEEEKGKFDNTVPLDQLHISDLEPERQETPVVETTGEARTIVSRPETPKKKPVPQIEPDEIRVWTDIGINKKREEDDQPEEFDLDSLLAETSIDFQKEAKEAQAEVPSLESEDELEHGAEDATAVPVPEVSQADLTDALKEAVEAAKEEQEIDLDDLLMEPVAKEPAAEEVIEEAPKAEEIAQAEAAEAGIELAEEPAQEASAAEEAPKEPAAEEAALEAKAEEPARESSFRASIREAVERAAKARAERQAEELRQQEARIQEEAAREAEEAARKEAEAQREAEEAVRLAEEISEATAAEQRLAEEEALVDELTKEAEAEAKAAEEAKIADEEAVPAAAPAASDDKAPAKEAAAAPKVKYNEELEIPDPEPTEEEKLSQSHTLDLSKVGENTIPSSLDDIIMSETPEERRIRILHSEGLRMNDDQRKIFTYFARIPGMDNQILSAMSAVYQHADEHTSAHGNIAVMGAQGCGKSKLTRDLVTAMCLDLGMEAAKTARITGFQMNKKDPAAVVDKMAGGFLMIEECSEMNEETVAKLSQAMEFRTDRMILFLEDEKAAMRGFLRKYPEFSKKIEKVISIPIFTNDELITFARTYAAENNCELDDMAVLALYTIIGNNQSYEQPMTIARVKGMIDQAITHASRNPKKKRGAGRRGKGVELMTLQEKDFETN